MNEAELIVAILEAKIPIEKTKCILCVDKFECSETDYKLAALFGCNGFISEKAIICNRTPHLYCCYRELDMGCNANIGFCEHQSKN